MSRSPERSYWRPYMSTNDYYPPFYYIHSFSDDGRVEYHTNMTDAELYSKYSAEEIDCHKVKILHTVPVNTSYRSLFQCGGLGGAYSISTVYFPKETTYPDNKLPDGTDVEALYNKVFFGVPGRVRHRDAQICQSLALEYHPGLCRQ